MYIRLRDYSGSESRPKLFMIQILALRVLRNIDRGLELSVVGDGIGPAKRCIDSCIIGVSIKNAMQDIKAINLAVKRAQEKTTETAATAFVTAAARALTDEEDEEDKGWGWA